MVCQADTWCANIPSVSSCGLHIIVTLKMCLKWLEVETSHTSSMATIVSRNNSKPSRWWGVVNLKMYRVKSNQKYWLFCCKYIFNNLFSSSVLPFDFLSAMPCRERPKWMYVFIFWQRSSAGCTVKGTRTRRNRHTPADVQTMQCPPH